MNATQTTSIMESTNPLDLADTSGDQIVMDTNPDDTIETPIISNIVFGEEDHGNVEEEVVEDTKVEEVGETKQVTVTVEEDEDGVNEAEDTPLEQPLEQDASDMPIGETLKPIEEELEEHADENGEEEEEEDENREMTREEKHAMVTTVRQGDIDLLDDLLDSTAADINMKWFNENLLMVAIRAKQLDMAYFLIDNGVDFRYTVQQFRHPSHRISEQEPKDDEQKDSKETTKDGKPKKMKKKEREREKQKVLEREHEKEFGAIEVFETTCRQMAYDYEMMEIVDIIDEHNGEVWPWQCAVVRPVRLKKTIEEKQRERGELPGTECSSQRALSVEGDEEEKMDDEEEVEECSDEDTDDENQEEQNKSSKPSSLKDGKGKDDKASKANSRKSALSATSKVTLNVDSMVSCDAASSGYETLSSQTSVPTPTFIIDYPSVPTRTLQYSYPVTKSFLSRKKVAMDLQASRSAAEAERPLTSRGSFRQESKLWTPIDSSRKIDNDADKNRSQSLTRYVSPWKEDDPSVVSHLRKRAGSSSQPRDRAPDYKRAVTFPDIHDKTNPAPTVRSESTLYQSTPRQSYTPRRQYENDSGRYARSAVTARHSRMDTSPPRYTRSEGGSPTRLSRLDFAPGRLSSRIGSNSNGDTFLTLEREKSDMSILSPRAAKVCRQGWSVFQDSKNKKRLNEVMEKKSMGAKKYSPAGMIKTVKDETSVSTKSRTTTRSSKNIKSDSVIFAY